MNESSPEAASPIASSGALSPEKIPPIITKRLSHVGRSVSPKKRSEAEIVSEPLGGKRTSNSTLYTYLENKGRKESSPLSDTRKRGYEDKVDSLFKKISERKCLIIYTGGTLGMARREYDNALEPRPGFLVEMLDTLYLTHLKSAPDIDILEWDPLIDSSDIHPMDWRRLADDIVTHYYTYDGFVVIHGTDTMSYTASALSFMLKNLGKPVILTGAQIPLAELYNDARNNLVVAVTIAAQLDIPEVCLYFNGKLFRGNRTTKIDSWNVEAFISPNYPSLATAGVQILMNGDNVLPAPKRSVELHSDLLCKVLVLHLVPGFSDIMLEAACSAGEGARGVVLLLYGTGNAPQKKGFIKMLAQQMKEGLEVVILSQCKFGSVKLDTYATGIQFLELGVIDGKDMTVEACVTKLAYLMALGYTKAELKDYMETNLRGEITEHDTKSTQRYWDMHANKAFGM